MKPEKWETIQEAGMDGANEEMHKRFPRGGRLLVEVTPKEVDAVIEQMKGMRAGEATKIVLSPTD